MSYDFKQVSDERISWDNRTWSKRQMTKTLNKKERQGQIAKKNHEGQTQGIMWLLQRDTTHCIVSPKVTIKGVRQTISDKTWDWSNRSCQRRCLMEGKEEPLKPSMSAVALLNQEEEKISADPNKLLDFFTYVSNDFFFLLIPERIWIL